MAGGTTHVEGDVTERIRSAALDLFAEVGYGSTTIDMIAASAEVGVASLYRRWPDKSALANDLVESTIDDFTAMFDQHSGGSSKQRFMELWARIWSYAQSHPSRILLVEGQTTDAFLSPQNGARKAALNERVNAELDALGIRAEPAIATSIVMGTTVALLRAGIRPDAAELGERLWSALRAA